MHIERAFRVINLLDVPEHKRKFWPQQSAVVVRSSTREILDVIQFDSNVFTESERYAHLYPDAVTFFAHASDFQTVADLEAKIAWCFESHGKTYVLGRGMANDNEK